MSNVATRLFTLIMLLQSRPNWQAAELAAKLEVSPRTVHRYFKMLDEMGIPVYTTRGPGGGFSLVRGYKLPPLLFTAEEASALYLGANLVKDILGQTYAEAATAATAKLDNVLPADIREEIAHTRRTLVLDGFSYRRSTRTDKHLHIIRQSLQLKRSLLMQYTSRSKSETIERRLDPYGLSLQWGMWYLAGFCHLRQELRTFRVERIQTARLTEFEYEIPEDFSIRTYLRQMAYEPKINVELEILPPLFELIKEQYCGWMTLSELPNGNLHAAFSVHGSGWINRFIINLGENARIISPPELIESTKALAAGILKRYAQSDN